MPKYTKRIIEKEGRHCLLLPGDLRDRNLCNSSAGKHVKRHVSALFFPNTKRYSDNFRCRFGALNVLVNNASKQYKTQDFENIDLDMTEDVFRCNVIQMITMAKFALPHMSRGDSCVANLQSPIRYLLTIHSILNTSSIVTFRGSSTMIDYSATKGAIIGFARSLAKYLIPKGIRVNAVA